ncbi:P-loop containing nucleoside triphosphate hydrolase protein [Trametes meyenii]|nr:P-loop containing nucleoside triphosphate hydrolase protein [Trametes meyenii]
MTALAAALMPAITLWYHGQLLRIMQTVLDTRTLDKDSLVHVCIGRVICAIVNFFLIRYRAYAYSGVDAQLQEWHARRLFRARARLDVPTYETASVQAELSAVGENRYSSPPVSTVSRISQLVTTAVQVCAQVIVLARVLKTQKGGLLYAALTLAWQTSQGLMDTGFFSGSYNGIWVATAKDGDYRRYHGWERVVKDKAHRKEPVANDLVDYALSEYEKASDRLGSDPDRDFIQWQATGPNTTREKLLLTGAALRKDWIALASNGSGKSTILKLALRLYDPEEGQILFNGHAIRTLRLKDLRQAISVLFQDYTHFPLSIRDNIAIGDPSAADNDERTAEEAYGALRCASGIKKAQTSELSGGQMQRLALARTFMRSVVSKEGKVGLLLFDEPSASLDPVAEHELFERLRELRGSKTMLFSLHRFGNMMRRADLIMRVFTLVAQILSYCLSIRIRHINESTVVAQGTHDTLVKQQGEYAKMWALQAQAFL